MLLDAPSACAAACAFKFSTDALGVTLPFAFDSARSLEATQALTLRRSDGRVLNSPG